MPVLFIYLFKVSISLTIVWLFYHLLLRKLTFYNWNRGYLLGYTLLSFLVPFINISTLFNQQHFEKNTVVQWVPAFEMLSERPLSPNTIAVTNQEFSLTQLLTILFLVGMLIMFLRMIVQYISFKMLTGKSQVIEGEGMKVYQVDETIIPFSFGNAIFINRNLHTEEELKEIIRHEFIHVKQKHTLDI